MGCAQSLSKRMLSSSFDVEVFDPATATEVSFTNLCAEEQQMEDTQARRAHAAPAVHQLPVGSGAGLAVPASLADSPTHSNSASLPSSTHGDLASQWRGAVQEGALEADLDNRV